MGSAIAERLLAQGHRLTVCSRNAGRAAALVTRGATLATTLPIMFHFAHPVAANRRRAQKTCALHEFAMWQCAPKARTISEGGSHPDNCR